MTEVKVNEETRTITVQDYVEVSPTVGVLFDDLLQLIPGNGGANALERWVANLGCLRRLRPGVDLHLDLIFPCWVEIKAWYAISPHASDEDGFAEEREAIAREVETVKRYLIRLDEYEHVMALLAVMLQAMEVPDESPDSETVAARG